MKAPTKLFAIALAGVLCLGAAGARAAVEVSAAFSIHATADFYAPLTPHGAWIEVGSYGRCWHPRHVAVGWRPYAYGHWVWTDVGWYWVSDEPWAWACYHYGAWVYHGQYGWVWVPGTEWAPAWVSWRVGGGYIGWAPLPPRGAVSFRASSPAPLFVFVELRNFHRPVRPANLIVNNTTVINKTTVINNLRTETRNVNGAGRQKIMINEGPGLAPVQKATGNKVTTVSVQEAVRKTPVPATVRPQPGQPNHAQPPQPGTERERENAGEQRRLEGRPSAPKPPPEHRPLPKQEKREPMPRITPPSSPQPPAPTPPGLPQPPPNGKGKHRQPPQIVPPLAPLPPGSVPPEKEKGGKKERKGRPE